MCGESNGHVTDDVMWSKNDSINLYTCWLTTVLSVKQRRLNATYSAAIWQISRSTERIFDARESIWTTEPDVFKQAFGIIAANVW